MNYYMTQRPAGPGAMPRNGLVDVLNYDGKPFIPEIGREAWSRLTYNRMLTAEEIRDYELTPAPSSAQMPTT